MLVKYEVCRFECISDRQGQPFAETHIYSVSQKKSPLRTFFIFFQNGYEFFKQILRTYYAFLSTVDYNFLFNYLQLWWSYAILSMTT